MRETQFQGGDVYENFIPQIQIFLTRTSYMVSRSKWEREIYMFIWKDNNSWSNKEKEEGKELSIKEVSSTHNALYKELLRIELDIEKACFNDDYVTLRRLVEIRFDLKEALHNIETSYRKEVAVVTNRYRNVFNHTKRNVGLLRHFVSIAFINIGNKFTLGGK